MPNWPDHDSHSWLGKIYFNFEPYVRTRDFHQLRSSLITITKRENSMTRASLAWNNSWNLDVTSIRDTVSHSIIICFNSSPRKNEFNSTTSAPIIIGRVILMLCHRSGTLIFHVIVQSRQATTNLERSTYILGKTVARRNTTSHCDRRNENDQMEPHNGRPVCITVDDQFLVILLEARESLDVREMTN